MDRNHPLKIEDSDDGGGCCDSFPTSMDPNEDFVDVRGVSIQNDSSDNESVYISRDSSDNLIFTDTGFTDLKLTDLYDGHWDDEGSYYKPEDDNKPLRLYDGAGAYTVFAESGITSHSTFALQSAGQQDFKRAVASNGEAVFSNTSSTHYHGIRTHYGTSASYAYVKVLHNGTDAHIYCKTGEVILTAFSGGIELYNKGGEGSVKNGQSANAFTNFYSESGSYYHGVKFFYGTDSSSDYIKIYQTSADSIFWSNSGQLRIIANADHVELDSRGGDTEIINGQAANSFTHFHSNKGYYHGIKLYYGDSSSSNRLNIFHNGTTGYISTVPGTGDGITINPDNDILQVVNGLELYAMSGDLSSPPDGTIWYNKTTHKLRVRINGSSYNVDYS